MSKKYRVVVSNTVLVQVKGSLANAVGEPEKFKFSLTCNRVDAKALKAALEGENFNFIEFMHGVTTAWNGQRLVLEDDGTPAEFCTDAFDALLNISGMALMCFNAFTRESSATEKNS